MKRVLILVTALLALVVTLAACGEDTVVTREVEVTPTVAVLSPQQVADAYVQAINAGDVQALATLWAKDGTFTFGPFPDGSSETENGLASDIEDLDGNAQLSFSGLTVDGDTATGQFSFTDDETVEIGLAPVTGTFEAVIQQGKIQTFKATADEASQQKIEAAFGPPPARELTVLVGDGQDTSAVFGYFPSTLCIRAGDTVVWKLNSDEFAQVMFTSGEEPPEPFIPVPDGSDRLMLNPQDAFPSRPPGAPVETYSGTGFFNSGGMSKQAAGPPGTPPNDTFSLIFDIPGTYVYGGTGQGKVIVEPSDALDVPSQAEIDVQGQEELAPLKAFVEELQAGISSGQFVEQEARPDGTSIWLVSAGLGTEQATALEFSPKDLTIKQGDTVVWTSNLFHTVTFHQPPPPEFVIPEGGEQGPPLLIVNPQVMLPVLPSPEFDPAQYYNSGLIGPGGLPGGSGFSLTFNQTGITRLEHSITCAFFTESLG